jgi:hypothetical protein
MNTYIHTYIQYSGEWFHDEPHGYGIMTYRNGDEYNGPFEQGVRHGEKGTMDTANFEGKKALYIGQSVLCMCACVRACVYYICVCVYVFVCVYTTGRKALWIQQISRERRLCI